MVYWRMEGSTFEGSAVHAALLCMLPRNLVSMLNMQYTHQPVGEEDKRTFLDKHALGLHIVRRNQSNVAVVP